MPVKQHARCNGSAMACFKPVYSVLKFEQKSTTNLKVLLTFEKYFFRNNTHVKSMKGVQFSRAPPPLSSYVQNSPTPLTLDVQFETSGQLTFSVSTH